MVGFFNDEGVPTRQARASPMKPESFPSVLNPESRWKSIRKKCLHWCARPGSARVFRDSTFRVKYAHCLYTFGANMHNIYAGFSNKHENIAPYFAK